MIVKVFIGSVKEEIIIYPNPVTDGMINLQLNYVPSDIYKVRMINTAGQIVFSKQQSRALAS